MFTKPSVGGVSETAMRPSPSPVTREWVYCSPGLYCLFKYKKKKPKRSHRERPVLAEVCFVFLLYCVFFVFFCTQIFPKLKRALSYHCVSQSNIVEVSVVCDEHSALLYSFISGLIHIRRTGKGLSREKYSKHKIIWTEYNRTHWLITELKALFYIPVCHHKETAESS